MRLGLRAALVLNRRSGALLDGSDEALPGLLADAGLAVEIVGEEAGSLPERIAAAAAMDVALVIVAGGDGTIACAASVLAGSGVALGILPFGTMNLLAKDLGIPVGDPAGAVRVLAAGERRAIDVGAVNGSVFLCASMLGLPARLGRYREAIRRRRATWLRFGLAALRAALRFRVRRMVLDVGGERVMLRSPSVTIAVNALDDRSGRLFGRSRLDGGELAAYVVRRRLTGMIVEHRGASIVVRSGAAGMHVMNDGERMILAPPLRYEVRPGALIVMAPRRSPGR